MKNYQKQAKLLAFSVIMAGLGMGLSFECALAGEMSSKEIINFVNNSRAQKGLDPLRSSEKLTEAARDKAKDMIKNDYFAHTAPSGKTPWYWLKKNAYDYKYAGENLAINFTDAEKQHTAWMKSQSHRENILNSNYQEIGVAVLEGKVEGNETLLVVQYFGTSFSAMAVAEKEKIAPQPKVAAQPAEQKVFGAEQVSLIPKEAEASNLSEDVLLIPEVNSVKTESVTQVLENFGNSNGQANMLNVFWLGAWLIFFIVAVAGPLIVLWIIFLKKTESLSAVANEPKTFALVRIDEFTRNTEQFWHKMKKTVPG